MTPTETMQSLVATPSSLGSSGPREPERGIDSARFEGPLSRGATAAEVALSGGASAG